MGFIHLYPDRMADIELIRDLARNFLMALDKHASPNDILEVFDDLLDEYETLHTQYQQR